MRRWGWFLRGQLQVWIKQSFETRRHKFAYHPLAFWGSGRNDDNDSRVHNIRNTSLGKCFVALVSPSPGMFVVKETIQDCILGLRCAAKNGESSMRHLHMCQCNQLCWDRATASSMIIWALSGFDIHDNAQTCMQLGGGKLLSSSLHGDLKPQLTSAREWM